MRGNGLFHNKNFLGILNLKKNIKKTGLKHGQQKKMLRNDCSQTCLITFIWYRFQEEINTGLNSFLYKIVGESHEIRAAFVPQLSAENFYLTIANLFLFEYKQQPFL